MTTSSNTPRRPRIVKVYDLMITYNHNTLHQTRVVYPMIRLSGKWLADCGFAPGQRIEVVQEPQRLVIQLVPVPVPQSTTARRSRLLPHPMVQEVIEREEYPPAGDSDQFEFYPSPTEPGAYLRRRVANPGCPLQNLLAPSPNLNASKQKAE